MAHERIQRRLQVGFAGGSVTTVAKVITPLEADHIITPVESKHVITPYEASGPNIVIEVEGDTRRHPGQ